MDNLKSGLLKPDGTFIPIPYYNLMKYCQLICQQFCQKSVENQKQFDEFIKEYKTYKPYLDFVTRKLGYVQFEPLFLSKTTYGGEDGLLKGLKNDTKVFKLPRLSDKELQIRKISLPLDNCVIDAGGNMHCFDKEKRHPIYMLALLNYYLSQDKQLYLSYLQFLDKQNLNDLVASIRTFMYEYCGFSDISLYDNGGILVMANEEALTDEQIKLLKAQVWQHVCQADDGSIYEAVTKKNKKGKFHEN